MTTTTAMKTIDTRVMDCHQMRAYLQELAREQHEGIVYMFAAAKQPRPSGEMLELIAQAEGMGYRYDVHEQHFVMEKPEEHDFLFWNIPVVGTVDSESGVVRWG